MSSFIINGNKRLSGEVTVSGSKNASLPLIFATITMHGTSVLENLPDISDVRAALRILESFGAKIVRDKHKVYINTEFLEYKSPDVSDTSLLRASTYLIGSMLVRFGKAPLMQFGGCNFDTRPIDMHIMAALALGARLDGDTLVADKLSGSDICFDKISVGATVNALIMASGASGKSRIYNYASEPHVDSLIALLSLAGAKIEKHKEYIAVEGRELSSAKRRVVGDMIEAGTYLALSLLTNSSLRVKGADYTHLTAFFNLVAELGGAAEFCEDFMIAEGELTDYAEVITEPYPAFPTDLQPIAAPLFAAGCGGRIFERVWHNRFGYLEELSKFGVEYKRYNGYADIYKSKIKPARAKAIDLRGGASLLLCALLADGESVIDSSEIILRGYENIIEKLSALGADIKERNT